MRRTRIAVALSLALLVALCTVGVAVAAVPTDTSELRAAVNSEGILEHEQAFQEIADQNGGTRASGTPGYDASADYVAEELRSAGYTVTEQKFDYELFLEQSEPVLDPTDPDRPAYTPVEDFVTMEYSRSGDVTKQLVPTNDIIIPPTTEPSSTSGCEASDFPAETAGNIALIQRGTCTFRQKVDNAAAAGAVGAIIFNEGQEGRTEVLNGTLDPPQASIPAVGTSFDVGQELYGWATADGGQEVRLKVDAVVEPRSTTNVIADYPAGGRTDRTVVVGAHLDSVIEGPGINDNGSGSAGILEIALQMRELGVEPRNHVRFAFWGAEESGLIGSEYYVNQLSKRQLKNIAVNLNFDMIGSPNYVRFVYDGDGSDTPASGPSGSGTVEDVFNDYFASQGLATEPTAFDGRSDYGPFIEAGIPAGGLFTGAEDIKTAEEAEIYGGVAELAYDPCYHQACDTLKDENQSEDVQTVEAAYGEDVLVGNVNVMALDEMADGAAHATLTFAQTNSAVSGTDKASNTAASKMEYKGPHAKK